MNKQKIAFIEQKFLKSIGGVETHGTEFVKYFSKNKNFEIDKIFAKEVVSDGINLPNSREKLNKKIIRQLSGDLNKDTKLILSKSDKKTKIFFFNNPAWITLAENIKKERSDAQIIVRSGGNDILAGWIFDENDKSKNLLNNRKKIVETINKYIDVLIVNSYFSKKRFISIGIEGKKMKIISGGVDCKVFKPSKMAKKKIIISFWGRWVKFKGIKYSLRAIKEVSKINKNLEFIMIGEGPEKSKVLKEISRLGLKKVVLYKGIKEYEKIPSCVKGSKIFIHLPIYENRKGKGSSYIHTETMGRTYCEASAMGMTSVVSDVGGSPEMIKDGINGFVVKERDYLDSSKKLLKLIQNPKLLKKMCQEGRKLAKNKYAWPILFKQYEELFKK